MQSAIQPLCYLLNNHSAICYTTTVQFYITTVQSVKQPLCSLLNALIIFLPKNKWMHEKNCLILQKTFRQNNKLFSKKKKKKLITPKKKVFMKKWSKCSKTLASKKVMLYQKPKWISKRESHMLVNYCWISTILPSLDTHTFVSILGG